MTLKQNIIDLERYTGVRMDPSYMVRLVHGFCQHLSKEYPDFSWGVLEDDNGIKVTWKTDIKGEHSFTFERLDKEEILDFTNLVRYSFSASKGEFDPKEVRFAKYRERTIKELIVAIYPILIPFEEQDCAIQAKHAEMINTLAEKTFDGWIKLCKEN